MSHHPFSPRVDHPAHPDGSLQTAVPTGQASGSVRAVAAAWLRAGWLALCLVLVAAGPAHAQENTSGDNPTGYGGDFNGDVTSGGCYDPYTGNAKRVVTDLVVPGASGAYPLAFTRTFNSNLDVAGNDIPVLGDGVDWRHSYQWALTPAGSNANGTPIYEVSYPDGSVFPYRMLDNLFRTSRRLWNPCHFVVL